MYPCDVLFIHRDAEGDTLMKRKTEIEGAIKLSNIIIPYICVIPIRMQEAWLLINEMAIREAASNPNGKIPIKLPSFNRLEEINDPKEVLYELLRSASGLKGRREKDFRPQSAVYRMAQLIEDYSVLRGLTAFENLEIQIQTWLSNL